MLVMESTINSHANCAFSRDPTNLVHAFFHLHCVHHLSRCSIPYTLRHFFVSPRTFRIGLLGNLGPPKFWYIILICFCEWGEKKKIINLLIYVRRRCDANVLTGKNIQHHTRRLIPRFFDSTPQNTYLSV